MSFLLSWRWIQQGEQIRRIISWKKESTVWFIVTKESVMTRLNITGYRGRIPAQCADKNSSSPLSSCSVTLIITVNMPENKTGLVITSSFLEPPLTSCCFQRTQEVLSLYCCHWSSLLTHARGSRCHDSRCRGFHCRVIQFHSHWTHCSSSPRPPRGAIGSVRSCDGCVVRQKCRARCCRCPPMGGRGQARLGCSHPSGAAVPWSCTLRTPLPWSCTLRLRPYPPAPGSERAWGLNLLTSGEVLPWAWSRLFQ